VQDALDKYPELVCELTPLEEEMRVNWPLRAGQQVGKAHGEANSPKDKTPPDGANDIVDTGRNLSQVSQKDIGISTESGGLKGAGWGFSLTRLASDI
jgi:hypothetical protein